MGKCPKCSWKGSPRAFMKHYASAHYRRSRKAKKAKASKRTFKTPVWARHGCR